MQDTAAPQGRGLLRLLLVRHGEVPSCSNQLILLLLALGN
jgi:hypothetical protein